MFKPSENMVTIQ